MSQSQSYLQKLVESTPLRTDIIQAAINFLRLPQGSHGIDAGCGIGAQAAMLAEAVGNSGHVTAIDKSEEFLAYAEKTVQTDLLRRIAFRAGDIYNFPCNNSSVDWVWSCDCIGYPSGDLLPWLQEVKRVLRPGGTVAILAWTSQQFLPGYPLLEARLNATCSGIAPYCKGIDPTNCFQRAMGSFQKTGFKNSSAKTFVSDVILPFEDEIRIAMISLFEMLWGKRQSGVSDKDWQDFKKLCYPDSPDFILNIPDYYGFFTYSMFTAQLQDELE